MRRRFPQRPVVGVGAVVFRDDRVLLIRRRSPPMAGHWSLPGGAQRLGETVFEAARREVLEETRIEIAVAGLIDVVDLIERAHHDGLVRYHYTLIDVWAHWQGGEAEPQSDAAEAAWFDADRLDGLQLWAETRRVISRANALRLASAAP